VGKIWTHPGGTANFCQENRLSGTDDFAEAKTTNYDICILARVFEQQVFRLEVTVDDTTPVKVCDSAEDSPDEICGIPVMEEGKTKHPLRNMRRAHFS